MPAVTSFRLEVGDAVHDDVMEEQGLVVDLDVSGEQAAEVLHIPEQGGKQEGAMTFDLQLLSCGDRS